MASVADARSVLKIEAIIIEKITLQNMVRVNSRFAADKALVIVTRKDLVLELFPGQKFE
ncbi:hypothetical protein [Rhizobium sp. MHM7A]|uniref:hypothetical protein n=1 Tax=Rhizobium sp. MHM7A TaxID=2583233 RepID=UPI0014864BC5|nr:hypothetical protein [Rhizobium sp. MHM7A]